MIWPILEARAEIQKYFCSFFGSNEDVINLFWDFLTFSSSQNQLNDFYEYFDLILFLKDNLMRPEDYLILCLLFEEGLIFKFIPKYKILYLSKDTKLD